MKPACRPQLEHAITATMSYFDLMEFPLTAGELQRWLWQHTTTPAELTAALATHPHITHTDGFYHLKNRSHLVPLRLARYGLTETKLRKRHHYLRWLATLPHVQAILISDSIGLHNARVSSDIDIAIITTEHKIWSTRFWAAFPAQTLGLRPKILPTGQLHKRDKICLCFYTTTAHLNLQNERITTPDIDFVYWLASMFPIYDRDHTYEKFIKANAWLRDFLPNFTPFEPSPARTITPFTAHALQTFVRTLSPETALKNLQKKILHPRLRELAAQTDSRVIIQDDMLKLHMNDTRLDMQKQWQEKMPAIDAPAENSTLKPPQPAAHPNK